MEWRSPFILNALTAGFVIKCPHDFPDAQMKYFQYVEKQRDGCNAMHKEHENGLFCGPGHKAAQAPALTELPFYKETGNQ